MPNLDRRLFIKNTSLGVLLANVSWYIQGFHDNIWTENKKYLDHNVPSNELHFVRDVIELKQSLVNRIQQSLQDKDTIVISARNIILSEDVKFTNANLVLVTDNLSGNNKVITILPQQRRPDEFSQPGYDGKQLTVFAKNGSTFSVVLNGSDGIKGATGKSGDNAVEPPRGNPVNRYIAGTSGGTGLQGGKAGSGGNLIVNSLTSSTLSIEKVILNPGSPGGPGDGGPGGFNLNCTIQVYPPSDCVYQPRPGGGRQPGRNCAYQQCDRVGVAAPGPVGQKGEEGSQGHVTENKLGDKDWYTQVALKSPTWSEYRTTVGEYYFRSINNPNLINTAGLSDSSSIALLALSELEAAVNLSPQNTKALLLYNRIIVLHTPLGQPRFVDLIPDFEVYEKNYIGYFAYVSEIRRIASDYRNLDAYKAGVVQILNAQKASISDSRQAIEIQLKSIIYQMDLKKTEIDERIKTNSDLASKIDKRKQELSEHSGFGQIIAYVEVAVAIASAACTAGASLVAAAQGIVAIANAASSMADAIKDIHLLNDVKNAIGELVDSSKKQPDQAPLKRLNKGATDFKGAYNNFDQAKKTFKQNVDIILDVDKTISQIKSYDPNDPELKSLLGQQADNMREILNLRKDLELLGYNKEVASQQIEVFLITEKEIGDQLNDDISESKKLRLNFARMVKRSQFHMDFIMQQIFSAVRSLEIQQFKDYSYLIRYDYGYYHPDLDRDLIELNDEPSTTALFEAYNNTWSEVANVTSIRAIYDGFALAGGWTVYYLRLSLDKVFLKNFLANPQDNKLAFTIDPSNKELSDKKYIRIQSVKMSFVGAKLRTGDGEFNASLYQSGSVYQRVDDNSIQTAVLSECVSGIGDVQTKKLSANIFSNTDNVIGFSQNFMLSYRSVFGHYEVIIAPDDLTKLDLSGLNQVQIWFKLVYKK